MLRVRLLAGSPQGLPMRAKALDAHHRDDEHGPMAERGQNDGGGKATEHGAPHGITLFDHAQIAAELAEGDQTLKAVLDAHELTESQWNESTLYWMQRMGDDVLANAERARIPIVYSDAFSQAQDAKKPLPPLDVEQYAELVAAVQAEGDPARPLAVRSLSNADYLRLSRHFAKAMAADAALSQRYFERLQALGAAEA
jgi:hypothetical protein